MSSNTRTHLLLILAATVAAGVLAGTWDNLDPWLRGLLVALLVLVIGVSRRPRSAAPVATAPDARVQLHDLVLADETRRPWAPTLLPWTPADAGTVLLVPAADYHLAEIVPLASELAQWGVPTRVALGESPWARTWPSLSWYPDLELFAIPDPEDLEGRVSAVLVMKDTGSLGPFVDGCRTFGIPTIGKVEGAQDFWDADTPEERKPYRNLDLVLCQGRFDAEALSDRETAIVGSTRLERLWWAPPVTNAEPLAVINLNFVYGVRTADRKLWLETAIEGCELAGIPYVISVHPAERSRIQSDRVTSISASRLLPRATVLISRFSTVPLEAMARGVPFVYHNPHGETVKTFADPMGAFEMTKDAPGLADALSGVTPGPDTRTKAMGFFSEHVDLDPTGPSEVRGAGAVRALMAR